MGKGKDVNAIRCTGQVSFAVIAFMAIFMTWIVQRGGISASLNNADVSFAPCLVNDESFALANEQSFGFFDDIRESDWKIAQMVHAKVFPNHVGETPDVVVSNALWYGDNFREEFHCAFAQRIPSDSSPDGPKWVCDPHRIAKKKDCLVYSVGSYGNTMFEVGVKQEIGEHCEIHTFDIVTQNHNGDFKTLLDAVGVHFHAWGIGTQQQADEYKKTTEGTPMYTLKQTIEMLNHTGRVVDIFKIDCELCEWDTYKDWLVGGDLRQILVETHFAPMPQAMDFFYTLHDAGYVIFNKEPNYVMQGSTIEYAFLKLSPEFFVNGSMYSKRKSEQMKP